MDPCLLIPAGAGDPAPLLDALADTAVARLDELAANAAAAHTSTGELPAPAEVLAQVDAIRGWVAEFRADCPNPECAQECVNRLLAHAAERVS